MKNKTPYNMKVWHRKCVTLSYGNVIEVTIMMIFVVTTLLLLK